MEVGSEDVGRKASLWMGPRNIPVHLCPFQMASEKTQISTNWGEGGNAHSDYLGLLAEAGIPGMIIYLVLIFVILKKGISLYKRSRERETKIMLLCMIAGLVTYLVHGALNNFLDTDKISALFWGMIAVIVATGTVRQNSVKLRVSKDPRL